MIARKQLHIINWALKHISEVTLMVKAIYASIKKNFAFGNQIHVYPRLNWRAIKYRVLGILKC